MRDAAVEERRWAVSGRDPDQVAQVAAGEEGLLGGGDDDAADGVLLGLQAVGDGGEGVAERLVHGVRGLVGVVEDEGDDAGRVLFPADGGALGHDGCLREVRSGRVRVGGSEALDDGGDAHAAADAQGGEAVALVLALQFVDERAEDHRAGGAERVAQRDGAAVDVDLVQATGPCP